MREILFRGKQIDDDEWVEGYYTPLGDDFHYILTGKLMIKNSLPVFEHFPVIPETIGQYTGLTDKNGTKIFEGDIVENVDGIYVVEYCENLTRFALVRDNLISGRPVSSGTVIGNIHDNDYNKGDT